MAPKTLLVFCDGTGMDGALEPPRTFFHICFLKQCLTVAPGVDALQVNQDSPQGILKPGGKVRND